MSQEIYPVTYQLSPEQLAREQARWVHHLRAEVKLMLDSGISLGEVLEILWAAYCSLVANQCVSAKDENRDPSIIAETFVFNAVINAAGI